MSDYLANREWSDKYIPAIRNIVGPHLLCESSLEVDRNQAADLVVLKARDITIACRMRRPGYATRYPYDITIRSRLPSGAKTEISKIFDGWADWMFYGHATKDSTTIERWLLVDLDKLRGSMIRHGWQQILKEQPNGDGTCFMHMDVRQVPSIVIASSHALECEVVF